MPSPCFRLCVDNPCILSKIIDHSAREIGAARDLTNMNARGCESKRKWTLRLALTLSMRFLSLSLRNHQSSGQNMPWLIFRSCKGSSSLVFRARLKQYITYLLYVPKRLTIKILEPHVRKQQRQNLLTALSHYTLASVCKISLLFSIHFLRRWWSFPSFSWL